MEPGKIPHEIRHGELAQLGILPFQPYYGTHDATSLFVIVISYLYQWLGDAALLERYLPERRGRDRAGSTAPATATATASRSTRRDRRHGYYNQGWKDAGDAIPHADGSLAPLPLALCELQGYVYDAKLRMADIYEILGRPEDAARLRAEAHRPVRAVQRRASGGKRRARTTSASTGEKRRSRPSPRMPGTAWPAASCRPTGRPGSSSGCWPPTCGRAGGSGRCRRTIAPTTRSATTPGTVWPHDNAMIAGGFRRYGHDAEAAASRTGSSTPPSGSGQPPAGAVRRPAARRRPLPGPVPRARTCRRPGRPARSSGSIAVLCGIHATTDRRGSRLYVDPALPDWLPELTIRNLRAGRGCPDAALPRRERRGDPQLVGLPDRAGAPRLARCRHRTSRAPDDGGPSRRTPPRPDRRRSRRSQPQGAARHAGVTVWDDSRRHPTELSHVRASLRQPRAGSGGHGTDPAGPVPDREVPGPPLRLGARTPTSPSGTSGSSARSTRPFTLTWEQFKTLPRKTVATDIHCVTRWSKLDTTWEGVPIQEILGLAQVRPAATHVLAHSEQGYTANMPLVGPRRRRRPPRRHLRRPAARAGARLARSASSSRSATSGRAPSGSAASSSSTTTSSASGSATATTTTPIPGRKSATASSPSWRRLADDGDVPQLASVTFLPPAVVAGFPFDLPALASLSTLTFDRPVTLFVGENGSASRRCSRRWRSPAAPSRPGRRRRPTTRRSAAFAGLRAPCACRGRSGPTGASSSGPRTSSAMRSGWRRFAPSSNVASRRWTSSMPIVPSSPEPSPGRRS